MSRVGGAGAAIGRVRAGVRVMATDGHVGTVTEVLVGDRVDECYLRVRTGGPLLFGRDRYIAAYDVRQVDAGTVWLKISRRDALTIAAKTRPHAFAVQAKRSVDGPIA